MRRKHVQQEWKDARTLHDLGQLMARWLEGRIRWCPGYCGDRIDAETLPLVRHLAAYNRSGWLTVDSQPGDTSGQWRQRAAVQGYAPAPVADRIARTAQQAGLLVSLGQPLDATTRNGRTVAWYGEPLPDRDLRAQWGKVGAGAYDELRRARHITVAAPEFGPAGNRMWPLLTDALR
ncbi:hypothetical protein QNO07_09380 [Streptomyces sp. 549]|uniref:DUF6919 domain-containing protein n=1 Tax=Streptomyces sp. 549 TaxID=3049076 RepID=UPI0024C26B09|nr:hypothetical protein [Streptomyces sp. 549]MDK1473630.1 hypothetical protein [Streptomyces sp. 549]